MRSGEATRTLAGRYELREEIARGGMGIVWRAEDTLLGRAVAVKEVLLPHAVRSVERSALQRRMLREARASAALGHPGIVTVFDVIQEGDEGFIVMELVDSPSLDTLVRSDGPLPVEQAIGIAREAAEILREAHAGGVTHRDVKPGNVIVTPSGHVKLADFGISSIKDDPSKTSSGELLGSPSYMSPEQARGEHAGPETDLWGLGATLFFAVEGVPPFDAGQAVPTLNAVVHDEPRRMERAGSLAPVISALLTKDPASRPSGAELERMLESAGASSPAVSEEPTQELNGAATAILPGPVETPTPTTRLEPAGDTASAVPGNGDPMRRRLALGAAIAALVVIAVLAYAAFGGDSLPQRRDLVGSRRTHVTATTTTPRRSQPSRDATPSVAPTTPSQGVPKPAGGGTGPNGNAYGHGNGQGHGNGENNGNGNAYGQRGEGD